MSTKLNSDFKYRLVTPSSYAGVKVRVRVRVRVMVRIRVRVRVRVRIRVRACLEGDTVHCFGTRFGLELGLGLGLGLGLVLGLVLVSDTCHLRAVRQPHIVPFRIIGG